MSIRNPMCIYYKHSHLCIGECTNKKRKKFFGLLQNKTCMEMVDYYKECPVKVIPKRPKAPPAPQKKRGR